MRPTTIYRRFPAAFAGAWCLTSAGAVLAQSTPNDAAPPEVGVTSAQASADASPEQELEMAFWKADDLFTQGRYEEAAASFTRALELSQQPGVNGSSYDYAPGIAFNIAQSHRRAGNCDAAQMAYAHYSGLTKTLPPEHVEWHRGLLDECPGLRKALDDTRAPTESPSSKLPPKEPSGSGQWLLDVNSPPADKRPQGDSRETSRLLGWSAAGAAAVSFGAATGFWISGNKQDEIADGKRLYEDAAPHVSAATTRWTVAGVFAGAGLAFAGVSVYLFTQSGDGEISASERATIGLRSGGTDLSLFGEF
jgi:tetratricopeptide (TPR) repeat protein